MQEQPPSLQIVPFLLQLPQEFLQDFDNVDRVNSFAPGYIVAGRDSMKKKKKMPKPLSFNRWHCCLVSNVCMDLADSAPSTPGQSSSQLSCLPALTSPIYVLLVRTSSEFSACTLLCAIPVSLSVCVLSNYMCPVWPFCAALLVHTYTWLDFCLPA
jgi:hypothetical protein